MDDERRAYLRELTNDCIDIASVAAQRATTQSHNPEAFGMIVSRLAETLLANELRRDREGLREA